MLACRLHAPPPRTSTDCPICDSRLYKETHLISRCDYTLHVDHIIIHSFEIISFSLAAGDRTKTTCSALPSKLVFLEISNDEKRGTETTSFSLVNKKYKIKHAFVQYLTFVDRTILSSNLFHNPCIRNIHFLEYFVFTALNTV